VTPDHPELQEHLLAVAVDAMQFPLAHEGLQIAVESNEHARQEKKDDKTSLARRTRPNGGAFAHVRRDATSAVRTGRRANG
jgi:hypothetical protein